MPVVSPVWVGQYPRNDSNVFRPRSSAASAPHLLAKRCHDVGVVGLGVVPSRGKPVANLLDYAVERRILRHDNSAHPRSSGGLEPSASARMHRSIAAVVAA